MLSESIALLQLELLPERMTLFHPIISSVILDYCSLLSEAVLIDTQKYIHIYIFSNYKVIECFIPDFSSL